MADKVRWTTGAALVIAEVERRRAEDEVIRMRLVVLLFLRKCLELEAAGRLPGGLRGVVADLGIGECSIIEFIDDLLYQAYEFIVQHRDPRGGSP